MATRTSSPPGSRSRAGSSDRSSTTRARSTRKQSRTASSKKKPTRKPAARRGGGGKGAASRNRRPAPRAVRTGRGPIARFFDTFFRGVAAVWLAVAHGIGAVARGIGHGARDLEPEHRRDGVGLFMFALSVISAAAVWFQLGGPVMGAVRVAVTGSVGKVGWLVPLMLLVVGWRNLRDPIRNGPAGRQVVGWSALGLGLLGIVHVAEGNPQPVSGDAGPLREGGGAVGYVVSSLLLDLLRTPYVVVPVLLLLCVFGVLVITATPLYKVPRRLAAARDRALGRERPEDDETATRPMRGRGRRTDLDATGEIDPLMGDPAYDSPLLRRRRKNLADTGIGLEDTQATGIEPVPAADPAADPSPTPRPSSSRRRTRRCPTGSSSSRCPATSSTTCPATRCSSPARRTRRAPRPATTWSAGSPRSSKSSTSTRR